MPGDQCSGKRGIGREVVGEPFNIGDQVCELFWLPYEKVASKQRCLEAARKARRHLSSCLLCLRSEVWERMLVER